VEEAAHDNRSGPTSVLRSARRRWDRLDDVEIRSFLEREYPRLVNAVALVSGSYPLAEDAVQEALVRAWIRSERGERLESLPSWVAAVALNHARSGWRRAMVERRARSRLEESSRIGTAPNEDHLEVMRALAALPRREREVAVLRYLLDFDTKETAAALSIGEGTVKSSLSRARAHLADQLRVRDLEVNDVEGR
jgi:RNA polymerase sigma factor (sigma-70 family)